MEHKSTFKTPGKSLSEMWFVRRGVGGGVYEWVNEWVNEWVRAWVGRWVSEWIMSWLLGDEWIDELAGRWVCSCQAYLPLWTWTRVVCLILLLRTRLLLPWPHLQEKGHKRKEQGANNPVSQLHSLLLIRMKCWKDLSRQYLVLNHFEIRCFNQIYFPLIEYGDCALTWS